MFHIEETWYTKALNWKGAELENKTKPDFNKNRISWLQKLVENGESFGVMMGLNPVSFPYEPYNH